MNQVHPRLMNLMLNEGGIPLRVRDIRLGEFEPKRFQREAYIAATEFVVGLRDRYISPKRPLDQYPDDRSMIGVGLLFTGPAGTGKTTIAALTVQEIFLAYRLPVFFTTYADMVQAQIDLIRAEKNDDPEEWNRLDTYLRKCWKIPVLALDDIGKERRTGSGFAEDTFDRLVRHRYVNAKPTILTTNLDEEEWDETYNASMRSFLNEAYEKFVVAGGDQRGEG